MLRILTIFVFLLVPSISFAGLWHIDNPEQTATADNDKILIYDASANTSATQTKANFLSSLGQIGATTLTVSDGVVVSQGASPSVFTLHEGTDFGGVYKAYLTTEDLTADHTVEFTDAGLEFDGTLIGSGGGAYVTSEFFDTSRIIPDGTNCAAPATVTIGGGPTLKTIICADSSSSTLSGNMQMPDSYDGGSVSFELIFTQTAADTGSMLSDIEIRCYPKYYTIGSGWGTSTSMDDGGLNGGRAMEMTPAGSAVNHGDCAGGSWLTWQWTYDAASTTDASTLNIIGMNMEYGLTGAGD